MNTQTLQQVAQAYGISTERLQELQASAQPHHCLGLWNTKSDGFYAFVRRKVRATEGIEWLTHDRTANQILDWWREYSRPW